MTGTSDDGSDIHVPLPYIESDEEEEGGRPALSPPSAESVLLEELLRVLALGGSPPAGVADAAESLLDQCFWASLAETEGLHVLGSKCAEADAHWKAVSPHAPRRDSVPSLRASLDARGYITPAMLPSCEEPAVLKALCRMCRRLRSHGFAPVWIFIFDEAWHVLRSSWYAVRLVSSKPHLCVSQCQDPSQRAIHDFKATSPP